MSDTYQAVYDAVRSKLSGCDIGSAVESAIFSAGIGNQARMVADRLVQAASEYASEYDRPSVVFKPTLTLDGNQWLAIYGDLTTGCVGVGNSPSAAMYDFDREWHLKCEPVISPFIEEETESAVLILSADGSWDERQFSQIKKGDKWKYVVPRPQNPAVEFYVAASDALVNLSIEAPGRHYVHIEPN